MIGVLRMHGKAARKALLPYLLVIDFFVYWAQSRSLGLDANHVTAMHV